MIFYSPEPSLSQITWNNSDHWTKQELKCTTAFQKYMADYRWDITEFSVAFPPYTNGNLDYFIPARFKDVSSPTFSLAKGTEFESEWAAVATLTFTGHQRCSLGLYIMMTREVLPCKKIVDCSVKILKSNGDVLETAQMNQVFESHNNSSWGWTNYKDLETLYREKDAFLGNDNTLHILVDITVYGQLVSYTQSRSDAVTMELKDQIEVTTKGHGSNMTSLLNSGMLSDALLVCGPTEFPVHVNILSAQSEVFQRIFETKMMEGISRRLEVHGVEPDTMLVLLEYVYSGDVPALLQTLGGDVNKTSALIRCADMYLLQDLKDTCFLHLLDQICQETAGALAILAYYHCPSTKVKAGIAFYCQQNWAVLSKNPDFLKCVASRPEAFSDHFGESEPFYSAFPNPRIVEREDPEPRSGLPFAMKMAVGAYFAGLAAFSLGLKSYIPGI